MLLNSERPRHAIWPDDPESCSFRAGGAILKRSESPTMETDLTDPLLIEQARQGNLEAFEALVHRHAPNLYRLVRRMSSDASEAEAVVQEAFLRVWASLDRYQNNRPFFPYLATIAVHIQRDQWRKDRHEELDDQDRLAEISSEADDDPLILVEEAEALQALARAVAQLPPLYRAAIALRYEAGLRYEEIAAAMNIPLNTVRTYLKRARARLRRDLEEVFYAPVG